MRLCALVLAVLGLVACEQGNGGVVDKGSVYRDASNLTAAQVGSYLADRTNMFYDSFHGTQVEYTTADGRAYLWYPGNRVILPGEWKVEEAPGAARLVVCFKYGPNTYNPSTGHRGASWECGRSAIGYITRIVEARNGDVLGLARRIAPPFPLAKDKTTLDDLAARVTRAGS